MRRLLLFSVLLLSASWVAAENYPSSGQKETSKTSAGSPTTVEGCLSESSGKYALTDSKGTVYELTGETSKLSEHVGHEMKITGAASGSASASGGSMGHGASETLDVSSFKHISKTCRSAGGAMSH